jgi:hypothetical protein
MIIWYFFFQASVVPDTIAPSPPFSKGGTRKWPYLLPTSSEEGIPLWKRGNEGDFLRKPRTNHNVFDYSIVRMYLVDSTPDINLILSDLTNRWVLETDPNFFNKKIRTQRASDEGLGLK